MPQQRDDVDRRTHQTTDGRTPDGTAAVETDGRDGYATDDGRYGRYPGPARPSVRYVRKVR